jgi:hypothetical protein
LTNKWDSKPKWVGGGESFAWRKSVSMPSDEYIGTTGNFYIGTADIGPMAKLFSLSLVVSYSSLVARALLV